MIVFLKTACTLYFDTWMAPVLLLLKATELGLEAHPIGGYNEEIVKKVCAKPDEFIVITLIIVNKKGSTTNEDLIS